MSKTLLLILINSFLALPLFSQKGKKADETFPLLVHISYSGSVTKPPDSVTAFIATCFALKKVTLIDSISLMELASSEMVAVMKKYKEKGEPLPEYRELSSKFKTVGYFFHLRIFRNYLIPGAPVDSVRWVVMPSPLNFEKKIKGLTCYPDNHTPEGLYIVLKKAVDEVLSFLARKEQAED